MLPFIMSNRVGESDDKVDRQNKTCRKREKMNNKTSLTRMNRTQVFIAPVNDSHVLYMVACSWPDNWRLTKFIGSHAELRVS